MSQTPNIYAGIGNRNAPNTVLLAMSVFAHEAAEKGWLGRSGGAPGSDEAFKDGAATARGMFQVLRPGDATPESIEIASRFHPAWDMCRDYVRKLHGRNVQIILGHDLKTPAKGVACWTPNGGVVGGTAMGIKIAKAHDIPVYNYGLGDDPMKML